MLNGRGITPLQMAILSGKFDIADQLVNYGACTQTNTLFKKTNFHFLFGLIFTKNIDAFKFCLKCKNIDLLYKNYFDETFFHQIVQEPSCNYFLTELLSIEEIKKASSWRNIFGHTPLDIAIVYKNDAAAKMLGGEPNIRSHPNYGKIPIAIDQSSILDRLRTYLKLRKRDASFLVEGQCNGFTFLAFYYLARGKWTEYLKILQAISQWDGSLESLAEKDKSLLTSFSGNYTSWEQLIEQWINDLVWFQHTKLDSITGLQQTQRAELYEIVKKDASNFKKIAPSLKLSKPEPAQIDEVLKLARLYPCAMIDFGGAQRSLFALVQSDGGFKFYNSNIAEELPAFYSCEILSKFIKHTFYNNRAKEATLTIDFFALQQTEEGKSSIVLPANEIEVLNSANAFTPIHKAVFYSDFKLLKKCLQDSNLNINAKTIDGLTPLLLAIQKPQNEEIVRLLMEHSQIMLDGSIALAIKLNEYGVLDLLLNSKYALDIDGGDGNPLVSALKLKDRKLINLLLEHGANVNAGLFWPPLAQAAYSSFEICQLLTDHMPEIDICCPNGKTFLSYIVAQGQGNPDQLRIAKLLLEKGANPHHLIRNTYKDDYQTLIQIAIHQNDYDLCQILTNKIKQ